MFTIVTRFSTLRYMSHWFSFNIAKNNDSHTRFINDTCCNWFCIPSKCRKRQFEKSIQCNSNCVMDLWNFPDSMTQFHITDKTYLNIVVLHYLRKSENKAKTYNGCANTSCIGEYPCMNVVQLFLNLVFQYGKNVWISRAISEIRIMFMMVMPQVLH